VVSLALLLQLLLLLAVYERQDFWPTQEGKNQHEGQVTCRIGQPTAQPGTDHPFFVGKEDCYTWTRLPK
jgi:hypothetical protein